jgi:uncharacterized protein YunC (DUF1805 family)
MRLNLLLCLFASVVLASCARRESAPDARNGETKAAADQAEMVSEPAPPSGDADGGTSDFWKGLERHEIQLGQILLVVKGTRGVVVCPYLNIESFAQTGEACAIVPAVNIDGMLQSHVTAVTPKAQELGIEVGMSGRDALDRIR